MFIMPYQELGHSFTDIGPNKYWQEHLLILSLKNLYITALGKPIARLKYCHETG
jgi:hypothetical protein